MPSFKWLKTFKRNCANWPAKCRHTIISQKAHNDFQNSFSKILNNGLSQTKYLESSDVIDRIRKMAVYHTLERVQVHGQLTIFAYHALVDSKNITDDLIHQMNVLAWCVEMALSYFLMSDDVEDGAKTRYGKPCWYLLPNVGTMVIKDSSMLRSLIYELLRQNLNDEMYTRIIKLFNETFLKCDYGQYLDSISARNRDFSKFDMDLYRKVSNNKFTFPSTKFPILIALTMTNKANDKSLQSIDHAMNNIGPWIQMHNDIMDWCDESITGKSNIDIKKGKPSWLAVTALQRCDSKQRKIFLSHYGSDRPEDVKKVLDLYEELNLSDVFCKEHCAYLNNISQQINDLPSYSTPSPEFFHNYIKSLYPFIVFYPEALEFDRKTQQHIYVKTSSQSSNQTSS